MKNWKTTSAGIIAVVGGICTLIFAKELNQEIITLAATQIIGGIGLFLAKDYNVTGTNTIAKEGEPELPTIPLKKKDEN